MVQDKANKKKGRPGGEARRAKRMRMALALE